ncbi:hypothetical protein D3C85_1170860 [compost metagenome]
MKTSNYFFIILLLIGTALSSCKKSDIDHENKFDESYKAWTDFKKSSGNSYRYSVTTVSWTGSRTKTMITVKDGQAIHRSYVSKTIISTPKIEETIHEEWQEDKNTLNTHSSGFKAITLDEVYQLAKTQWLVKRKGSESVLETKNNGMISACGYSAENCIDDCFSGISIESIEGHM